ncbi:hypothetical protein J1792_17455 [Streptomyces triculaminicus]|uniref:Uncharacterized protein n=2 Tax=Streptomyces TaxID=1883 RepID=A0A939FNQ2_9ACTN|nr:MULTISPECIES: hypothetical protein [Streptomyces]MBO0654504.1 hypothetical protein [Streptomyces triculaminicus]QSY49118.1 hypothetical protein J3S04_29740 [Streptomyces griseocarneus]
MSRAVVVLADVWDAGASAVASAVAGRLGDGRVIAVRPEDLARARWTHRVDARGVATTRLSLPTGQVLDGGGAIGAVLHRLHWVPPIGFAAASAKDRDYAAAELQALTSSWLLGIASRVVGVVNACGTARGSVSELVALTHARHCGLPIARRSTATRGGLLPPPGPGERHVPRLAWPGGHAAPVPVDVLPDLPAAPGGRLLVVGDEVVGDLAGRYAGHCRRLARRLGTRLFELRLVASGDTPVVAGIDLCPRLDLDGHTAAVADLLVRVCDGRPAGSVS